jgi:hypothetical protein
MTRREFDLETKRNMGKGLARDEVDAYRLTRMRETWGSGARAPVRWPSDYIADRARDMARRNRCVVDGAGVRVYLDRDGFLPTLGRGSKYRFPQQHRAATGAPLLDARVWYLTPAEIIDP